jgi:hypothetical protein
MGTHRCTGEVANRCLVSDSLQADGHDASSLGDVSKKLSDLAQENAFRRAINRVADADLIQDLNKEVEECVNNFMVCQFRHNRLRSSNSRIPLQAWYSTFDWNGR